MTHRPVALLTYSTKPRGGVVHTLELAEAHAVLVGEQPGDRALHVDVDAERDGALLQGADQLQAGAVADVGQPRVAVAAEVALVDAAVGRAVERRAELEDQDDARARQLPPCDGLARLLAENLRVSVDATSSDDG